MRLDAAFLDSVMRPGMNDAVIMKIEIEREERDEQR